MIKSNEEIKKEIEDSKRIVSETKEHINEIKKKHQIERSANYEQSKMKAQASWDKLSEKGLKRMNLTHRLFGVPALIISSLVIFVIKDNDPVAYILFLYSIYALFIFDARKKTSEYKNNKRKNKLEGSKHIIFETKEQNNN